MQITKSFLQQTQDLTACPVLQTGLSLIGMKDTINCSATSTVRTESWSDCLPALLAYVPVCIHAAPYVHYIERNISMRGKHTKMRVRKTQINENKKTQINDNKKKQAQRRVAAGRSRHKSHGVFQY